MFQFKSELICEALDDGVNWELYEPLVIDLGEDGQNKIITIPKGFVTDFGSIPWWVPNLIANPQGKGKRAYVMHDYLYRTQPFERSVCDMLLIDGMKADGVNWFQRATVYRGLRLGGWAVWDDYTRHPYTPPKTI